MLLSIQGPAAVVAESKAKLADTAVLAALPKTIRSGRLGFAGIAGLIDCWVATPSDRPAVVGRGCQSHGC